MPLWNGARHIFVLLLSMTSRMSKNEDVWPSHALTLVNKNEGSHGSMYSAMPGQIKAVCIRRPTNSNENGPFICVFNKPLPQWVAVVAHLCWRACCPFGVSEMVINSAALQTGELPMPATYQPPVTPNTAKCGAHPIPSHKTAQKRIQWMNSFTLKAFYAQIHECGWLPVEKKQTKYLQNIFCLR